MNREIKFRAWVVNSSIKEMIYPNKTEINSPIAKAFQNKVGYIDACPAQNNIENWQMDIVFMQFTGLKDKNGVDIYEGDICKNLNSESIGFIRFDYGWAIEYSKNYSHNMPQYYCDNLEIIGNIYENKELLNN